MTELDILALGYICAKPLPSGEWLAIQPMLYTFGLFIVRDLDSWRTRFCYELLADAIAAFDAWNGTDDPPGPWLVQKPEQRYGPGSRQEPPIPRGTAAPP